MQPKFKIGDLVNIHSLTYPDGFVRKIHPSTIFPGQFSYLVEWADGYGFSRTPWEESQLCQRNKYEQDLTAITEIIRAIS